MNGSLTLCLEVIFWFALFVVFYTYLGYGIVLYILVKLKELFVKPVKRVLPPDSDTVHHCFQRGRCGGRENGE